MYTLVYKLLWCFQCDQLAEEAGRETSACDATTQQQGGQGNSRLLHPLIRVTRHKVTEALQHELTGTARTGA